MPSKNETNLRVKLPEQEGILPFKATTIEDNDHPQSNLQQTLFYRHFDLEVLDDGEKQVVYELQSSDPALASVYYERWLVTQWQALFEAESGEIWVNSYDELRPLARNPDEEYLQRLKKQGWQKRGEVVRFKKLASASVEFLISDTMVVLARISTDDELVGVKVVNKLGKLLSGWLVYNLLQASTLASKPKLYHQLSKQGAVEDFKFGITTDGRNGLVYFPAFENGTFVFKGCSSKLKQQLERFSWLVLEDVRNYSGVVPKEG